MRNKPIVYLVCNKHELEATTHQSIKQYMDPLIEIVDCRPIIIPAIANKIYIEDISHNAAGVLLMGGITNVSPSYYNAETKFDPNLIDNDRDELSLPLIQDIVKHDIPLFAICRAFQEVNISYNGSLHQFVHELGSKTNHKATSELPHKERYEEQKHIVTPQKGGLLERIGLVDNFKVNSLHQQGIDKLGDGLFVEALADDGLIEAVSVPNKRFALGVQWHPEADYKINTNSVRLFEAFKDSLI